MRFSYLLLKKAPNIIYMNIYTLRENTNNDHIVFLLEDHELILKLSLVVHYSEHSQIQQKYLISKQAR